MRTVRGLSLLILLLLLAATVHAEEETRPLPVVCPVLDDFWGPKPGGLIRLGNQPLSLVILGTGRQVTDRRVEIEVEDTFFGVPPQGPITLRSHRPDGDMGRRIFYLQEDVWEDGLHALHGGSDPDMLPPTSANLIGAKALHGVAFSGDGSRYALTTEADDYPAEIRRRLPAGTKGLLRVHDTCTGETLLAIPLTRRPVVIALDETGHRAILAHTDGSIELIR